MKNINRLSKEIISQELESGWERITIILNKDSFEKLKTISDLKEIFIKDIVNGLVKIYNRIAITDPDFKSRIQEEKQKLEKEIKKLIDIQKTPDQSESSESKTPQ